MLAILKPSYKPRDYLLLDKGVNKTYLKEELKIAPGTIAKMAKGEFIALSVIMRICEHFDCQIQDVVQFVKTDEDGKGNEKGG